MSSRIIAAALAAASLSLVAAPSAGAARPDLPSPTGIANCTLRYVDYWQDPPQEPHTPMPYNCV
jgi:hypothetical protein